MIDQTQAVALLNQSLSKLYYSMAGYIETSNPYTTDSDRDAIKEIAAVAKEDKALAAEISVLVDHLEGVPNNGMPARVLAELNYLSYPWVLDAVVRDKTDLLASATERVEAAEGWPDVKALLEKIRDTHAGHIKSLQDVRTKRYKSEEAESA